MRTSAVIVAATLVSTAVPSIAFPIAQPAAGVDAVVARREVSDLEARSALSSILGIFKKPLAKELGKGALTGGAFAGLTGLLSSFTGGDDTAAPAQKRELSDDDMASLVLLSALHDAGALDRRDISDIEARSALSSILGIFKKPLAKELGKGALTGGAFAGLTGLLSSFTGGDDAAAPAQKRELSDDDVASLVVLSALHNAGALDRRAFDDLDAEEFGKRGIASLLEKFFGAGSASLSSVIKNAIAGGAAAGATKGALTGTDEQKRELSDDDVASLVVLSALSDAGALDRRELDGEDFDLEKRDVNSIITSILEKLFGGAVHKRDLEERDVNDIITSILEKLFGGAVHKKRAPLALGSLGKGLIGTGIGLGASTLGESLIDELKKLFSREEFSDAAFNDEDLTDDEEFVDVDSFTTEQKRSLFSSLAKLGSSEIGNVIKKGAVNGVGSAVGGSLIGEIISKFTGGDQQKRDLDSLTMEEKRSLFSSLAKLGSSEIGNVIKKGAVNGVGSAVGGSLIAEIISKFTGGDQAQRRSMYGEIDELD